MPSKIVKQKNFERNTRLIEAFCEENGIDMVKLNDGYQIRLEDLVDLYPVRARWHNIKTGERGDWTGYKDLRRVMLMALEMMARPEVAAENTYRLATTESIARGLAVRVEQKIRIVMKPKPNWLSEKMWIRIASWFIYVEKTEPKFSVKEGDQ